MPRHRSNLPDIGTEATRGLGGLGEPLQSDASLGRPSGIPARSGRGRRGHPGSRPPAEGLVSIGREPNIG